MSSSFVLSYSIPQMWSVSHVVLTRNPIAHVVAKRLAQEKFGLRDVTNQHGEL